jgi:pilus assembly protein Flp/PilA
MLKNVKSFIRNENGATLIEYGLIAALISVVAIVAIRGVGSKVNTAFTNVNNALGNTTTN